MLRRCVNPSQINKIVDDMRQFEKWELNVRHLQSDHQEVLSVGLEAGILVEMATQKMKDHLSTKTKDDDTYEDVKSIVLRFMEAKADQG